MIKNGFLKSEYDLCVYLKKFGKSDYIYLLLYVDYMLLIVKNMFDMSKVKKMFS